MRHKSSQYQPAASDQVDERFDAIPNARAQASSLFWSAYYHHKLDQFWSRLRHREDHLRPLSQVAERAPVNGRHYAGIESVSLDRINCSEGRDKDFDIHFRPATTHNKDRWVSLAAAWETGKSLPPVELIRIGDTYCVRDGHHRLSVARVLGQQEIDAEVTIWEAEAV